MCERLRAQKKLCQHTTAGSVGHLYAILSVGGFGGLRILLGLELCFSIVVTTTDNTASFRFFLCSHGKNDSKPTEKPNQILA